MWFDHTKRRNRQRKYLYSYLASHPCVHCGEDRPVCLEFHHVEPSIKSFNLCMSIAKDKTIEAIDAEIDKCIVLCANCHKIVTAKEHWRYNFMNTPD